MAETIHIHSETFHVELVLEELYRLPLSNWRKICRILAERSEYHPDTIKKLRVWFPVDIATAEIDWKLSRTAYEAGYKNARRVSKSLQHEQVLLNEQLRRARHDATKRLENLKNQYDIFKKEIMTNGNHDQ